MEPNRYNILTKIDAGERRKVYEYKQRTWNKFAPYFAIITLACWILFAMASLDIILHKAGDGFAILGICCPMEYIMLRKMDIEQWRPPTAEEMNELGDELI